MKFLSVSEKQTLNYAAKISKQLAGGEIFGLIGDLGAGKTVFTKGLAKSLGIKKITSPTFVLMKVHSVVGHTSIKFFVHIDAYRIESAEALIGIGANEYFGRPDTVIVIEWADKIKKILPQGTRFINIAHQNNARIIEI